MTAPTKQQIMAALATGTPWLALAGWTPSDLIAAGWTPRALRAAGWTPSDLIVAGWTPSALRVAGWTPSDHIAAGWTPSDLIAAEKEWEAIPVVSGIYTKLLAEIESGARVHNQAKFGPDCDPKTNLCKTPMCTAGHLINICGADGYKLLKAQNGDHALAARLIHLKNRPDVPPQNYGGIRQDLALAYIRERAAEEAHQEKPQ